MKHCHLVVFSVIQQQGQHSVMWRDVLRRVEHHCVACIGSIWIFGLLHDDKTLLVHLIIIDEYTSCSIPV
jgi:hypothetical protein